ncbi:MAG: TatD family hydrolase [Candidatus Omnitrophota bacterium]
MLIDTHCHLDFPEFDKDRDEVISRAKDSGLGYIINIGSSLKGSKESIVLAQKYDLVYATVGIHPHDADGADTEVIKELDGLIKNNKVVAVGECGLDYYRNLSSHDNQREIFFTLINLAKSSDLPVVVHSRQAEEETLDILKKQMPLRAVVHCFSADENFLRQYLDLGFYISFTCNITYKKANSLRNLVGLIPLNRLMLETDAPFLPPEGLRGQRNEPRAVKILCQEIAKIKGLDFNEVASVTTKNAKEFFRLP